MMTKDISEINAMLDEAAQELYEEHLEQQYQDFLEEMYYYWDCEQWDIELEFYNEFA